MTEDLGLEGDNYEWLLTAFYLTYIVDSLYTTRYPEAWLMNDSHSSG